MKIDFADEDVQPIIAAAVRETLAQLEADQAGFPVGCLALHEPDAAKAVGVERHALRDSRLRGEVVGAKVGKRVVYERSELLRFLAQQRIQVPQ